VISTVESFSLNSFGKMAAYVVLKAEEADILDTLEDDEREYAEQNFRFSVSADSDAIEENSSVAVGRILSGDTYENAKNVVKSRSLKSVVFDIDLRDESGTSVQPDGVVSVSTDLPEDFDKSKVSVYRLSDDGKKCYKLDSTISGERVMFTTDHFSVFVISEDADSTVSAAASPRTADDAPIAALAAVLVGAIAVLAVNLRKSGYC
jgi:hypothetical protein